MVRPAPATVRTVETLNFLTAHPGQSFTLSELSTGLGINMASMLAILQALVDAGYLVRHPRHKTYALGPSLVAVGHAALTQHRVIDAARAAMQPLADELGTECVTSVVIGDDIVIVATEGLAPARARDVRVGQRVPLVPPLGAIFLAWSDADAVEQWLARLGPAASDDDIARGRALLGAVRERGYSVGFETGARAQLGRTLTEFADTPVDAGLRERIAAIVGDLRDGYGAVELAPSARYAVSTIAAPVFGPDRDVVAALTLNGFDRELRGSEVAQYGRRLVATARSVSKAIHGRRPGSPARGRELEGAAW